MAPRIRELLEAAQTERTAILERMETLANRLDQSPGPQQVSQLQTEMAQLRTDLAEANAKIAAIPPPTLPTAPNPENVVDIPTPAPAPPAPNAAPTPDRKRPQKAWL